MSPFRVLHMLRVTEIYQHSVNSVRVSQVDSGREGEHGAEGRRDREPREQRGSGRTPGSSVFIGKRCQREDLHYPVPHLLHPGVPLSAQLGSLHPTPAPLSGTRDRETGSSG